MTTAANSNPNLQTPNPSLMWDQKGHVITTDDIITVITKQPFINIPDYHQHPLQEDPGGAPENTCLKASQAERRPSGSLHTMYKEYIKPVIESYKMAAREFLYESDKKGVLTLKEMSEIFHEVIFRINE